MSELTAAANDIRMPLHVLGGWFMRSETIASQATKLGIPPNALYVRGRSGPLGEPNATTVTLLFGLQPHRDIAEAMEQARSVAPSTAADAFLAGCTEWGRRYLADASSETLVSAAGAMESIIDAAPTMPALALALAWRDRPRPADPHGRVSAAAFLMRELRGGLHFAALTTAGLTVPLATVVEPDEGPARLKRVGWHDDEITELSRQAQRDNVLQHWQDAEQHTNAMFAKVIGNALSPAQARALTAQLRQLSETAHSTGATPPSAKTPTGAHST